MSAKGVALERNMERLGFRVAYTQVMMVRDRGLVAGRGGC